MSKLVVLFACFLFGLVSPAADIRAVWDHSGKGLYEGDWPRTMKVLKQARVTDLYLNVGGVDFAHYASATLPKSLTFGKFGDQLTAALRAAKPEGIRVHAWFICFNATRNVSATMNLFLQKGWRLRSATGGYTTYLDPASAGVRARVLTAIDELVRYPVDGVQLDFVRYGDSTVKPAKAAEVLSSFVAEARRRVKRPKMLSAAVYGKYPACISSVGQDWSRWLDLDIIDYAVPMDYTDKPGKFKELLAAQMSPSRRAKRTIIGIGVTATGLHLSPWQVVEQARLARQGGFAGVALFDLDLTLERSIFPALKRDGW